MTLPDTKQRIELIHNCVLQDNWEDSLHNRTVSWRPETGIIHSFIGGSALHGASVGPADLDIYGVFVDRPEYALGVYPERWETLQWSTSSDDRKNTPEDVDICLYSLRKWTRLAASGNPTVMSFLFAEPTPDTVWRHIHDNRHLFVVKSHVNAYLGYAEQQYQRMNGLRAQKTNRPELTGKFGYDVKMAMHMIRLCLECLEWLQTHNVRYPCAQRDLLIKIRQGGYSLVQVNELYFDLVADIKRHEAKSDLPQLVDRDLVGKLLANCYHEHWMLHDWYPQPIRWS